MLHLHGFKCLPGDGLALQQGLVAAIGQQRPLGVGVGRIPGGYGAGFGLARFCQGGLGLLELGGHLALVQLDQEISGFHQVPLLDVKGLDDTHQFAGNGGRQLGFHRADRFVKERFDRAAGLHDASGNGSAPACRRRSRFDLLRATEADEQKKSRYP